MENKYLTEQIITYLGNKRSLLVNIKEVIDDIVKELHKDEKDIVAVDLFSGSGVVARMLKDCGFQVIANDLESYSCAINECYLSNKSEFDKNKYDEYYKQLNNILSKKEYKNGVISENYAPKDDNNIKEGERVFYTTDNANRIDTVRNFIDNIDENNKKYFIAPLLYEASVHTNTSGVFKGFYKDSSTKKGKFGGNGENALQRIKGTIELKEPIFSEKENSYKVYQKDANDLVKELEPVDIMYIDPPYNQHPYGSNYFMLNVILKNKIENKMSKVSGIPEGWNHSLYNKKQEVKKAIEDLVSNAKSKYLVISYNSEGFVTYDEMCDILKKYGDLNVKEIQYNTFRASRNLSNRDKYVKEFLFVLKKSN